MACDLVKKLEMAAGERLLFRVASGPLQNKEIKQFLRKSHREAARPTDSLSISEDQT